MGVVSAVEAANARQKKHLAQRVRAHFGGKIEGKTFAVWGLAFKPNTDDMREAPALTIIEELLGSKAKIRTYDPVAMTNARKSLDEMVRLLAALGRRLEVRVGDSHASGTR